MFHYSPFPHLMSLTFSQVTLKRTAMASVRCITTLILGQYIFIKTVSIKKKNAPDPPKPDQNKLLQVLNFTHCE